MSALALETSRVIYLIVNTVGSILSAVGKTFIVARQEKANFEIAKMIHASGDYRNESFDYILHMVRTGRIHDIFSK